MNFYFEDKLILFQSSWVILRETQLYFRIGARVQEKTSTTLNIFCLGERNNLF